MTSKGFYRKRRIIGGLMFVLGATLFAAAALGEWSATPVADAQQTPRVLDITKDSPSPGVYRLMVRTWPS